MTIRPLAGRTRLHIIFMTSLYDREVKPQTILIIEDDLKTGASVDLYLRHDGFKTELARTGTEGLDRARSSRPDLIVLDLMLPGIDGIEICRTLRGESAVPIIMLTARSTEEDKLRGLDLGADDYVTKPFSPRELVARVRAVLRRAESGEAPPALIRSGDLVLDTGTRQVMVRGEEVSLTAAEFRLLEVFLSAPGRVFTRDDLVRRVLGEDYEGLDRTIDVHVKNLRRKVEPDRANPTRIVTVFGVGYKFVPGASGS